MPSVCQLLPSERTISGLDASLHLADNCLEVAVSGVKTFDMHIDSHIAAEFVTDCLAQY